MKCEKCGHEMKVGDWPFCPHGSHRQSHGIRESEATAVYRHRGTGHTIIPGRNDVPLPKRYARQGYEKVFLKSPRDVRSLEREKGVISHELNYDKGTGRSAEDGASDGSLPPEVQRLIREGKITIRPVRR